jgi:hypothetical protein
VHKGKPFLLDGAVQSQNITKTHVIKGFPFTEGKIFSFSKNVTINKKNIMF